MEEEIKYLTNEEYQRILYDFCTLRQKIVMNLITHDLLKSQLVMDLTAGHGFLSFALNEKGYDGKIIDIGLLNDLISFKRAIGSGKYDFHNIQYFIMDSSKIAFKDNTFDFIVNFLGLEDINMTIGKKGVEMTLLELGRILKKNGILEIAIMIKGNEPSSNLNWKLWKYIGLNSIFYAPEFYIKHLSSIGCQFKHKFLLKTYKKMNLEQAREEILFACREAPKLFAKYNVTARQFQDVWNKYAMKIKQYGLGYYPEILVLVFKKSK
ncbi:MAG: class I SAM-dependent methyltransferase [Candidatus Odinarchaeota archaeon]